MLMYVDICFSFVMLARCSLSPEKEIIPEPTRACEFSHSDNCKGIVWNRSLFDL